MYGENEAGKSTIVNFIKCIFYGVDRNKSGNEFSEYNRFKPWNDAEFSGKIEYEIDGKNYSAFRDFNRNNCKVYDEYGNDITNTFNKDKERGVELGITHLGIDEETFINTLLVSQKDISVEIQSQKNVIQSLTNILQTGQESVSFDKIKAKLQKKILDEIGTEKSHNKPINIINREISEKEFLRNKLLDNRDKKIVLNENSKEIEEQLKQIENDISEIKQVLEVKEKYAELLLEKERMYDLTLKIKDKENQEKSAKSKSQQKNYMILICLITLIGTVTLICLNQYILAIAEVVLVIISLLVLRIKDKPEIKTESVPDFAVIKEEINKKESKELNKLVQNGIKNTLVERRIPDLKSLLSGTENKKNDLILDGHKIKIEEGELKESIDRLSELEEQLADLKARKENLEIRSKVINIAIDKLEEAYNELKLEVIPEMQENIRSMVEKTTNGKYIKVFYNNEEGILIENYLGNLIPINKLSIGTVDQIYLGFRLGISKKLKNLPVILDESFAFYDNDRLSNMLTNLNNFNQQIILMSCSNREKDLFNNLGYGYNYITLDG